MSKLEISAELLEALHELSLLLGPDDALEDTLKTVVDLSVATVPGCDSAGVHLRVDGRNVTAAASDEYTREIDKIQFDSSQGPCVSALETSTISRIDRISEDTQWPEFSRRAEEKGLASVLSLPLAGDGIAGALNLYGTTDQAFDDVSLEVAQVFAKQTTIALRNAQMYLAARTLADQLNESLKSRDTIGQAKGILMEREGISDEEAFDMLRTISQMSNVKLRDVAQKVIEEKDRKT